MSKEGVPLDVLRTVLRSSVTLQRIAELECSSEAADRDRVPCPGEKHEDQCVCDYQDVYRKATCRTCGHKWEWTVRQTTTPNLSGEATIECPNYLFPEHGESHTCGSRDVEAGPHQPGYHSDVPRVTRQGKRIEVKLVKLLEPYKVVPVFQGDPRGAVVKLKVPSGRTNDMGRVGICVPA